MSRRALGRGLGALLPEERTAGTRELPVDRIFPNPQQPRQYFDPNALSELQASISHLGVLVPILVREKGDHFELIAGERRWRAATAAGLATIPAIVRAADDRESMELAMVENLQRADLDPIEEAMGFAHLVEAFGFTQEALAERVGRSRPAIANALRLLTLPDAVKAYVRSGELGAGHARALLALPRERREAVAKRAVETGASVRSLEALASPRRAPGQRARASDPDADAVTERLRFRLGAPVAIRSSGRAGAIEIKFADASDLTRIVDILLGEPS